MEALLMNIGILFLFVLCVTVVLVAPMTTFTVVWASYLYKVGIAGYTLTSGSTDIAFFFVSGVIADLVLWKNFRL